MGRLLFGFAMPLLMVSTVTASDDLKTTLLKRENAVVEAIKTKNQKKLKSLLGSQAYSINPTGRRTTAQLLPYLQKTNLTSYKLSDVEAIRVNESVAILTYKVNCSGDTDGNAFRNKTYFATSTWELQDGQWMSVFYQETPIRE